MVRSDLGRFLSASMLLLHLLLLVLLLLVLVILLGNYQLQFSLLLFLLHEGDASAFFTLVDNVVNHAIV